MAAKIVIQGNKKIGKLRVGRLNRDPLPPQTSKVGLLWEPCTAWMPVLDSYFKRFKMCKCNRKLISSKTRNARKREGVPQAYVRARASSATLCSVHVLRVFLCIFYIKRESDMYQNELDIYIYIYIFILDAYPNQVSPCHGTPLIIILKTTKKCKCD